MKKLVLLVSVFLLVAGMVAADVTFAPTVTGSTSVTWGMDFKVIGDEMNSGFDTANATSLDLGITIDPVDAKGGEGIYGEVEISGLAVTAKSGADVTVAAPAIAAKLWFSEALYASIDTDGADTNYAQPLGVYFTYTDGSTDEGTWYDKDDAQKGAKVEAAYGNAGYGLTYMAGDLTATLSFVSNDKWGDSALDVKNTNYFKIADYDKGEGDKEKENGILSTTEANALVAAIFGAGTALNNVTPGSSYQKAEGDYTYTLPMTEVFGYDADADGTPMYQVMVDDGKVQLWKAKTTETDAGSLVTAIDTGKSVNSSLYTAGLDVAYTLTDVGTFKAYVVPSHDSATKMFDNINFGVMADIALASFDMVGLTVAADMVLNNSATDAKEKFDWELAVKVPVKVADLLDVTFEAAATDAKAADDNTPLDLGVTAKLMAAGATVGGKYLVNDFAEAGEMDQRYFLDVSYPITVGEGTVTPMVDWMHHMGNPSDGFSSHSAYLRAYLTADIIDNVTFQAKYETGDVFVAAGEKIDAGEFTFETKFTY